MNNHHSSGFAIVFFLVSIFIGTGVLGYHAYAAYIDNKELSAMVSTLQADVAKLNSENARLKQASDTLASKNIELITKNTELAVANNELNAALEKAVAENADLKRSDPELFRELEMLRNEIGVLRSENNQLKAQQGVPGGSGEASIDMILSSILPSDFDFGKQLAFALVIIALFTSFILLTRSMTSSGRRQRS